MNNIVIVNQGGMRYLFTAPVDVKLKKGDKVKCDTCRGVTDGIVWADSLFVDDETAELIGKLTGAKFPLKSVVGKEITSVEMFENPQQEVKPTFKFKAGDKVRVVGNTCCHGYPMGGILTLAECVTRDSKPTWNVEESDIWYIREDDLEPYTEPEQEPVKLYCVKDDVSQGERWLTKGKIYEFDGHRVNYDNDKCLEFKDFEDWKKKDNGLVSCLVPLVKREAKIGEYIVPTVMSNPARIDNRYDIGDVLKVTQDDSNISDQWIGKAVGFENITHPERYWECCVIINDEYLVLDGYVPEPEYYNGEVVCIYIGHARGITVGKVYAVKDGKFADDDGCIIPTKYTPFESLEDLNHKTGEWSGAQFAKFIANADK